MMKAILRLLESPSLSQTLAEYSPADPEDVDIQLVAHIGLADAPGSDLFYFRLLTPKSFARHLHAQRFMWGRSLLLVERFDYKLVLSLVETMCSRIDGDTWEDIAERISHYAFWEFDRHGPVKLDDYN